MLKRILLGLCILGCAPSFSMMIEPMHDRGMSQKDEEPISDKQIRLHTLLRRYQTSPNNTEIVEHMIMGILSRYPHLAERYEHPSTPINSLQKFIKTKPELALYLPAAPHEASSLERRLGIVHSAPILQVAHNGPAQLTAMHTPHNTLLIFDLMTGAIKQSVRTHEKNVHHISWLNGEHLIASRRNELVVWKLNDNGYSTVIRVPDVPHVTQLKIDPIHNLCTVLSQGTIKVFAYDLAQGIFTLMRHVKDFSKSAAKRARPTIDEPSTIENGNNSPTKRVRTTKSMEKKKMEASSSKRSRPIAHDDDELSHKKARPCDDQEHDATFDLETLDLALHDGPDDADELFDSSFLDQEIYQPHLLTHAGNGTDIFYLTKAGEMMRYNIISGNTFTVAAFGNLTQSAQMLHFNLVENRVLISTRSNIAELSQELLPHSRNVAPYSFHTAILMAIDKSLKATGPLEDFFNQYDFSKPLECTTL